MRFIIILDAALLLFGGVLITGNCSRIAPGQTTAHLARVRTRSWRRKGHGATNKHNRGVYCALQRRVKNKKGMRTCKALSKNKKGVLAWSPRTYDADRRAAGVAFVGLRTYSNTVIQ